MSGRDEQLLISAGYVDVHMIDLSAEFATASRCAR